ncbi:MAG TPA: hypothetical protein VJU14_04020 [Solirubrobacterales bacterium]|nr:hypothetical protein [Solirubrobacterales bacterium]
MAVVNGNVQNLREALERLVDLRRLQLSLSHLRRLVAIHLGNGYLGDEMSFEEGQQVVAQRPLVILDRARPKLGPPSIQPLGSEGVEAGHVLGSFDRRGFVRLPDAALNVRQDVPQVFFHFLPVPAFLGRAERHQAAIVVGAEADRPAAPVFRLDDAAGGFAAHQAPPIC